MLHLLITALLAAPPTPTVSLPQAADYTAPIQAALDAAATAGGGTVVLPAGTYRVSNLVYRGKNISDVVVVVLITLGKEAVSVISMRPANRHERELYAEY